MDKHGQFFPDDPQSIEELIDSLARRAAAQERMMAGLSPEQRAELPDLMAQAMADMGLASEMAHLSATRCARPGPTCRGASAARCPTASSRWAWATPPPPWPSSPTSRRCPTSSSQGYAGASLADIDEELLERALGRPAVDDLAALRQLERELERQGYLNRSDGKLELSPKAVRRLGATALRRVFAKLDATGRGEHDVADAGAAGELTGSSREWRFGDEQPLDVVRTVNNAVLRTAHEPRAEHERRVQIAVDDFEVVETERRTGAAVALLVDLSYSMALRGTWGAAKSTAMALHSLVTTRFPQDAIQIIGFSSTAQVLRPGDARRAVRGHPAGHQPAARADAGPAVPGPAPRRRAGGPGGHRRRADRPPGGRRDAVLLLAADARDDRPHGRRGRAGGPHRRDGQRVRPRPRPGAGALRPRPDRSAPAAGSSSPTPTGSGEYVVADYLRARRGRRAR